MDNGRESQPLGRWLSNWRRAARSLATALTHRVGGFQSFACTYRAQRVRTYRVGGFQIVRHAQQAISLINHRIGGFQKALVVWGFFANLTTG